MQELFFKEDERRGVHRLRPVGYVTLALLGIFVLGILYAASSVWRDRRTGGLVALPAQNSPPTSTPSPEATAPAAVRQAKTIPVATATATATATQVVYPKVVVTANKLHVRKGPGTDFEILDVVEEGDELVTWGRCGVWLHIGAGGTQGWVHGDYVDITEEDLAKLPEREKE